MRVPVVIEATSGSGGGSGGNSRNSFNLLLFPCAHRGHGWRDGPWSSDLMLADAATSSAPQGCWVKPGSSPLALNVYGRDVSTPMVCTLCNTQDSGLCPCTEVLTQPILLPPA